MTRHTLKFATALLLAFALLPSLHAQSELNDEQTEQAWTWTRDAIAPGPGKIPALTNLRDMILALPNPDEELLILASLLDLALDREQIAAAPIAEVAEARLNAPGDAVKESESLIEAFRLRLAHLRKITTEEDSDKDKLEALEDALHTLDTFSTVSKSTRPPGPLAAIEVPTRISAALVVHNRKSLDEINGVLGHLPAAIKGDKDALEKMLAGTKRVEKIISSDAYGRAILGAVDDDILDHGPFAGGVFSLFGPKIDPAAVPQWSGAWSTSMGNLTISSGGGVTLDPNDLLGRRNGTVDISYASPTQVFGNWEFWMGRIRRYGYFHWSVLSESRLENGDYGEFTGTRFELDTDRADKVKWRGSRP